MKTIDHPPALTQTTKQPVKGLYAIADSRYLTPQNFLTAVNQAIQGGARCIQYRDKHHDALTRERLATALAALCLRQQVAFIVNDDIQLARQVKAGVHLGREDHSLASARELLGPQALIGVSCYNQLSRALDAQQQGANYVAFGSFYPSPTKPDAVQASPALLGEAKRHLHIPLVAIGGITPANGPALITAGADAVAVISGLFEQTDVRAAAQAYARLFNP